MESKFKKFVSLNDKYPYMIGYRVDCACGDHEHSSHIDIEYDQELNDIQLVFYKTVHYEYWNENDGFFYWFKNIWVRIKKATKLIFTGDIEMSESFMLIGEDHINNFIEAMQEGLEHCNEYIKNLEDGNIKVKYISKEK